MRVLHFYKTYYPDSFGGVEQVIFQLGRESSRDGVYVIKGVKFIVIKE